MKLSKSANQKGAIHLVLLLAAIGLIAFFVISSSAEFKNKLFATIFPDKPSSFASVPISAPISGPIAGFRLIPNSTTVRVGDQVRVRILVSSDSVEANLFSAKLTFPTNILAVDRIDYSSSIFPNWVEQYHNNSTGEISLTAAKENPGLRTIQTQGGNIMADVYFNTIRDGNANISFTNDSAIYKNVDNTNILTVKDPVSITVNSGPVTTRKPDLRVSLDLISIGTAGTGGEFPVRIRVNLSNIGTVLHASVIEVSLAASQSRSTRVFFDHVSIGDTFPRETTLNLPPGRHRVTAVADPRFLEDELREDNNTAVLEVVVPSTTSSPSPRVISPARSSAPGDVTGNGTVDLRDYSALLSQFGNSGSSVSSVDLNNDQTINNFDTSILRGILQSTGVIKR